MRRILLSVVTILFCQVYIFCQNSMVNIIEKNDYILKLPNSWKVEEGLANVEWQAVSTLSTVRHNMNLVIEKHNEPMQLVKYISMSLASIKNSYPDSKYLGAELGCCPNSMILIFLMPDKANYYTLYQQYVLKNNKGYILTYTVPLKADEELNTKIIKYLKNSFKIK